MSAAKQPDASVTASAAAKAPDSQGEDKVVRLSAPRMLQVYLTSPLAITYMSLTGLLIPLRLLELETPPAMIGIFVGSAGVLGSALAVPAGALAEAIGPRRALLLGGVLNALAGASFALINNYWLLLAIQVARGVPHSVGWVAGQTYIMGIGGAEDRATIAGRFGAFNSMLGFFSPLLMATIAEVAGVQQAFWFVTGYSLFFSLLGLTLPDIRSRASGASSQNSFAGFGSALELLRLRPVKVALILTFVRIYIGSGWQPFYIVFLRQLGFPLVLIGTLNAISALVSSLTGLQTGKIARLMSKEKATAAGLALGGLGVALSPHLAVVPMVYIPSILMGIGSGLSLPLVMAILADHAPPGKRGVAMGMRTTGNQAATMVSPVAMGFIIEPIGMGLGFALHGLIIWTMLGAAMLLHLQRDREPSQTPRQNVAPFDAAQ